MVEIKLTNAGVAFPIDRTGRVVHNAIKNIDLHLTSGDRLGLRGPNGSGKTTLLRLLSGIYPPTQGSVFVEGSMSSMLDLHAGIDGRASGRENILFRSRLQGRSKSLAKQTVEDACDFGELAKFIDRPVDTYSAGMRMRLAFSIATAVRPQILIMDEWLSVGDEGFQGKAKGRLDQMVKEAEILVLASHNPNLLSSLCNRFLTLENGHGVLQSGPSA